MIDCSLFYKMVSSSAGERLSRQRGSGSGSRLMVSEVDLPEGWRFERRSKKSCVWFDENGRRYKSSKEVWKALRERGLLPMSETETEAEIDTVSEYVPSPEKKKTEPPKRRYGPPSLIWACSIAWQHESVT